MELLYGTKVSAMCRYMDTIFAQQPKAQIVIGTCYAKAMEQVLDDVLVKRRGKKYAVLGGKNLPASLKQEELFKSGTVPVLLLNLHQAASGLNLQNADFVFLLDETIPAEMYNQMVARVQRQGKPNKAKVLRFRCVVEKEAEKGQ
jgi:SNF2 family DNA or RNA helicase